MIVQQVSELPQRTLVVLGKPENTAKTERVVNAEIISHLNAEQLFNAISASKLVLTRPGYSTIMDLAVMKKKAVFVPTPGQTEQEYLGNLYHQKKLHLCVKQNELDVAKAIEQVSAFKGFSEFSEVELLTENVANFLKKC
jgi:UDP-N-acetylglucosamine:LPS N-acetylglucosamine transferase